MNTCMLSSQVYLDNRCNQEYRNIVVLNRMPLGPLRRFVRRVQNPPLSPFCANNSGCDGGRSCILALVSLHCQQLMGDYEIPDLFAFLLANGYTIDNSLTKTMRNSGITYNNQNLICFFSYNNNNR